MRAGYFIAISLVLSVTAQQLLKHGANIHGKQFGTDFAQFVIHLWRNGFIVGALAIYAVSTVSWVSAIARVDLSFAYPMLSLTYVASSLLAIVFFHEHITVFRWFGIGLVVAGVTLISRT